MRQGTGWNPGPAQQARALKVDALNYLHGAELLWGLSMHVPKFSHGFSCFLYIISEAGTYLEHIHVYYWANLAGVLTIIDGKYHISTVNT